MEKIYTLKEMNEIMTKLIISQDKSAKENAKNFKEIAKENKKRFKETDLFLKDIGKQLGNIGNNNGAFAEDFFYHGFSEMMQVNDIKYDYIEPNKKRKKNNLQDEYDIVLFNSNKLLIIEVKYNLKEAQVTKFYEKKLPKFKKLFPEYKDYTIHAAIAALSINKGAKNIVEQYGISLFTQSGNNIKKISSDNLSLSEF